MTTASRETGSCADAPAAAPARQPAYGAFALAALFVVISAAATVGAMRHQSATFDEILMPSAGARGFETGKFDIVLDHPPLAQYLYGLPVWLSGVNLPDESQAQFTYRARYPYAQLFFWGVGNDPERIAFIARLMGVAVAMALVFAVFFFTRRYYGDVAAVFAAGATAFLPDVLAHGGIAYNDVPMALAYFGAAWSLDCAARRPDARSFVLAGLVCGIALGVKFSAIALAPVAAVLVVCELLARNEARMAYVRKVALYAPLWIITIYLVTVAVYRGDFTLEQFRWGLDFNIMHAEVGHGGIPAWLLGRSDPHGFWYFFPVAFLLKTPAAFHLLVTLAVIGFVRQSREGRHGLQSRLRGPLLAGVVFLAFLMRANLNIGFRHALPLLPILAVVAGVGVSYLWRRGRRLTRFAFAGLLAMHAASSLSAYPDFIAWTSEYVGDFDDGYTALADSSIDWGQGLLELRDFMAEEGIDNIYLSYFGSAIPEGYGIDYVSLPSFFDLPVHPAPADPPRFIAISATNLAGGYVGDAFARFRSAEPFAVLGHSIFVFELAD